MVACGAASARIRSASAALTEEVERLAQDECRIGPLPKLPPGPAQPFGQPVVVGPERAACRVGDEVGPAPAPVEPPDGDAEDVGPRDLSGTLDRVGQGAAEPGPAHRRQGVADEFAVERMGQAQLGLETVGPRLEQAPFLQALDRRHRDDRLEDREREWLADGHELEGRLLLVIQAGQAGLDQVAQPGRGGQDPSSRHMP